MQKLILVVEDEFSVRDNITEILTDAGYRVVSASNGFEAVKCLEKETPNLIISDIMMPGMTGLEFLDYTRKVNRLANIPFILLTAKVSYESTRLGMAKGADDYLIKPFTVKDLLMIIKMKLYKQDLIKEQFTELKKNIALSVPHELRTPLTPIIGLSQMMLFDAENLTPDEIKEMSGSINKSALRLHTCIDKFVLLANLFIELNEFNRNEILENESSDNLFILVNQAVIPEMHLYGRADDLELEVGESQVKISGFYFSVCVKELVQNACKFSNPGTKIKVIGRENGNSYELSFEDNGLGLTTVQINSIELFNKHYEASLLGSGLGLSIVKKIVEFYGGELQVTSEPNNFTKFVLSIPTVKLNADNKAEWVNGALREQIINNRKNRTAELI